MNKKELQTIATQEQKLYLKMKYNKKCAKHYYNVAVKYRRQGNTEKAKMFWRYCKESCRDAEKAFSAWEALFNLKSILQLPLEKYLKAVDEKSIAGVKWYYENAFEDVKKNVPFSFIWAVQKTIKGGK